MYRKTTVTTTTRRRTTTFLIVLAVLVLLCAMAACGSSSDKNVPSAAVSQEDKIPNFEGNWQTAKDAPVAMTARIHDGVITIQWNNDEMQGLYWTGTWPYLAGQDNVTSVGDRTIMDQSLLASQDSTKKFTYKNGDISFKLTIVGVTTTIKLSK